MFCFANLVDVGPVSSFVCGVCMELFHDGESLNGTLLYLFLIVDVMGRDGRILFLSSSVSCQAYTTQRLFM